MPIWGDQIREQYDAELRLRIAAVVSAETGNYPIRPKRPMRPITFPTTEPARVRGVYELPFAPPGRRAFHLVASTGDVGYVDFPESWASRDLVRNLWKRLDREDPPKPELRVIRSVSDAG